MFDFLIIGGGIIGLLTAKELNATGARVAVIEKNSPGQQSSWAAGGILSPMRPWTYSAPVNAISAISRKLYQQLADELFEQTSIDPKWVKSGMLIISDENMEQAIQWCQQNDPSHQVLSSEQANKQFNELKTVSQPALYRPDVATIHPPKLLTALNQYLTQRGVTFFNGQGAQEIISKGQQVTAVKTANELITANEYIICAGTWSPSLLMSEKTLPNIQPIKGQMICFPPSHVSNPSMVMENNRYIIPRTDGRIIVGSTIEHTGFDAKTTHEAFCSLRDFAQQLYPSLNKLQPDAHWAGLRPSSPNSIPYICRVTSQTNLSLNAGHYRNGIVTAPASAQLIADILLNRTPIIDPEPYQLNRLTKN